MTRKLIPTLRAYEKIRDTNNKGALRKLFETDLFALLVMACGRRDMRKQWVLERCDEVQCNPNGRLDLWAREHFKSSIITFGKTLQDVLTDPEETVGIFSHTRPIAKGFYRQLKRELESNPLLLELFPDILWENARKEAPKWADDDGLIVKRKGNPKESTIEAWGLVDGQPIGKHFNKLVYDDPVTRENAANPDQRNKTLEAYEQSLNLGMRGGVRRIIGTRYHYADAYATMIERGSVVPRVYPATDSDGEPVLLSREELNDKRRDMGPFVYASQMMLDPKQDSSVGFDEGWLRTWRGEVNGNTYIIVDPANDKKKKSDYTAAWVVTASADGNFYVRDLVRDRLGLRERIDLVMGLHRKWQPRAVGYEQYGMMADIEAIKMEQNTQGYRFDITPLGGTLSKFDRIQRLMPLFEGGRVYLPVNIPQITRDAGGVDMVKVFVEQEFRPWPYSAHDDMLDSLARLMDEDFDIVWPKSSASRGRIVYPKIANIA